MFDFLAQKFSSLFSSLEDTKKITEKTIETTLATVELALLEADVPYNVVQTFIATIRMDLVGHKMIPHLSLAEQIMDIVEDRVVEFLGTDNGVCSFPNASIIMVMGLQGSGKTTTVGKLAHYIQKEAQKHNSSKSILVGSIDFYRPAAIDQLEVLAKNVGATFYRAQNSHPVMAAQEIIAFGKQNGYDIIMLDTAGRLHVDNTMLQELQDVDALIQPTHKILVLDSMTGQESLAVAQAFHDTVGFAGAILTKMDSDTRGGAAFAFRFVLKIPIMFVGEGEKMTDLMPFYPDRMAQRMLGMGDLQTFVEHVEERFTAAELDKMEQSSKRGEFSLQDFADQMAMMKKIGSLSQLLKYMPGMSGADVTPEMIERGEIDFKKMNAIITSMTPQERLNPSILTQPRLQRIAKGAGVGVEEVRMLLKRFEEVKQYAKL
jgi:signal recognition particle subunit SRP54